MDPTREYLFVLDGVEGWGLGFRLLGGSGSLSQDWKRNLEATLVFL